MYYKELRTIIREIYRDDTVFLGKDNDAYCYDLSIVGITDEGRLVYDSDNILNELMNDNNWNIEEAMDWYDYNILGAISNAGEYGPILVNNSSRFYEDAEYEKNKGETKK